MKWFNRKTPYSLYVTVMTHPTMHLETAFYASLSDETPTFAGLVIPVKCLCWPSSADQQPVRMVGSGGYNVHGCYSAKCHYRAKID